MTSIFELAAFLQENAARIGNVGPPQSYLERAARNAVHGYQSLEEAEQEKNTTWDGWGNRITPSVILDAVRYIRESDRLAVAKGVTL